MWATYYLFGNLDQMKDKVRDKNLHLRFLACCALRKLPSTTPVALTLPRRSTQAPLRHCSGHAQERHQKWFRQVTSTLQVSSVLQTEMSTLCEDFDRDQFLATWAQKW